MASKAAATDESHFLKALIKKEEALLQDERNALQDMEKNAKKLKAQKGRRTKSVCNVLFYRIWATDPCLRKNTGYCASLMTKLPAKISSRLGLLFLEVWATKRHFLRYELIPPGDRIRDANRICYSWTTTPKSLAY